MRIFLTLTLLLMLSPHLSAQGFTSKLMPKYGWLNDLDQAKAAAAKSGKPIFLVFRCEP